MNKQGFRIEVKKNRRPTTPSLKLEDGARVAVMGGGPAGSLFSYFLLDFAEKVGLQLQVDIYEPRDFTLAGPAGCNMCAGIISETLVQNLAVEGISLPPTVVQRGMDTYILHTEAGNANLETPHLEKRIGAVYRGAGPLGMKDCEWSSFDDHLLQQALRKGARLIRRRVEEVSRSGRDVLVKPRGGTAEEYAFLAVATGVNTRVLKLFEPLNPGFYQPLTTQTFVREYYLGKEDIERSMGQHTIHFFLLNRPGMDFAAIVPKGNYVTICVLGKELSAESFDSFLNTPEVKSCMPPDWRPEKFACHCTPRINIGGAIHPYADRMVFLGDSGVSRLYKDGIGAAYRAAKAAAATAVFHGVSQADFQQHYLNRCRRMEGDNRLGKLIFLAADQIKRWRFATQAMVQMVVNEQPKESRDQRMSKILWDMFTGSAPYQEIFYRVFHPAFWSRFLWYLGSAFLRRFEWKQAR
jgi:flavin-dependent dehydrogenase